MSIQTRQWSLLPFSSLQLHYMRLFMKGKIWHTSQYCHRRLSLWKFVEELDGPQKLPLISRRAQCQNGSKRRRPSSLIIDRAATKLRCQIIRAWSWSRPVSTYWISACTFGKLRRYKSDTSPGNTWYWLWQMRDLFFQTTFFFGIIPLLGMRLIMIIENSPSPEVLAI